MRDLFGLLRQFWLTLLLCVAWIAFNIIDRPNGPWRWSFRETLHIFGLVLVFVSWLVARWRRSATAPEPASRHLCPDNFRENVKVIETPQIFQALQAHWIWQDQLMWSRTQLLLTIQGATLVAASALSRMRYGWMMFFLAGVVSMALYRLAELDERDRDNTAALLNCLLITNLPSDANLRRSSFISYLGSGGGMIRLIIVGFVFLDFLLGTLVFRGWQP